MLPTARKGEHATRNPIHQLVSGATRVRDALRKEREVSHELHDDVVAVVRRLEREHPGLRERLERAYGVAVFPSVGRASALLGATFGKGEVYRHGFLVGYAGIVQLTLGVQLGGQTFTELVLFEDAEAFARFLLGKVHFASNASAVAVRSGGAATSGGRGTEVLVYSKGGFLLEAAIGGQKLVFRPAGLTRVKRLEHVGEEEEEGAGERRVEHEGEQPPAH